MFDEVKNLTDYALRNYTKFSRKNFVEKDENLLLRNYLENLYTLDILEQCFTAEHKTQLKALDIGSKNWFYVRGEHAYFKSISDDLSLDGVEVDAYRLYSNFYSRYETAKFYQRGLKNTNYIVGNLLDISQKYDYIVWLLPFVTKEPLRLWGLPQRFFMPQKLLRHAYNLLNSKGQMLIVNQGVEEAKIQKGMLDDLDIKYTEKRIVKSKFLEYKNDRYAFVVKK